MFFILFICMDERGKSRKYQGMFKVNSPDKFDKLEKMMCLNK